MANSNTIARSIDLCNQLVTLAQNSGPAISPTDGSAIQRSYAVVLNIDPDDPKTILWGKQVYFFPATQDVTQRKGDRQTLEDPIEISIVIAEMYLATPAVYAAGQLVSPGAIGPQIPPPNAWVDARVLWAEQLFDVLKPTQSITGTVGSEYYRIVDQDPCRISAVYDRDELLERRLFFCEMETTWRARTNLQGS